MGFRFSTTLILLYPRLTVTRIALIMTFEYSLELRGVAFRLIPPIDGHFCFVFFPRRGNPLHLCDERYMKLQKLWASHGVAEEIVHLMESNNNLMNVEWHHM